MALRPFGQTADSGMSYAASTTETLDTRRERKTKRRESRYGTLMWIKAPVPTDNFRLAEKSCCTRQFS